MRPPKLEGYGLLVTDGSCARGGVMEVHKVSNATRTSISRQIRPSRRALRFSAMPGDGRRKLIDLIRLYVGRATEEVADNEWRNIEVAASLRPECRPPTLPPHHSWKEGLAGCSSTSSPASTSSARSWASPIHGRSTKRRPTSPTSASGSSRRRRSCCWRPPARTATATSPPRATRPASCACSTRSTWSSRTARATSGSMACATSSRTPTSD